MSPDPRSPAACAECGSALATDQRYCLVCGARRGVLPPGVAVAVGDLATRHRAGAAAELEPPEPAPAPAPSRPAGLAPVAGALAVCVLLMLGVGSVIGAASTPGGITSLANTIVVSLSPNAHAAPARLADAGTGATGGGGAGGGSGGGGGGAGTGGGAASAPQAARTVTISATGGGAPTNPTTSPTTPATTPTPSLPPIHHVWEIVLSGEGYQQSFATPAGHPYLAHTLADQGTVLGDYDAVATSPLANEIALISGQGPTEQTLQDCPQYGDLTPGRIGAHAQALGEGCLYPAATETIGSELQIAGLRWRAYIQGIGDPGQRHPAAGTSTTGTGTTSGTTTSSATPTTSSTTPAASSPTTTTSASTSTSASGTSGSGASSPVLDTSTAAGCPHPALDAADAAQQTTADDDYVTWKNPWVYFRSVLSATTCARDDTGIDQLAHDLRRESTTPALSYIAPDPCDDGSETPCAPGARAGLGRSDAFLKSVVPEIERSPAYRDGGLILITFDESPQSGPNWSTASCCDQPTFPNLKGAAATTSASSTSSATTTTATSPAATTTTTTTTPAAAGSAGTTTSATPGTTTTGCPATISTTSSTATTPTTTTTSATSTTTSGSPCAPAITGDPPGGGQVGLLMISPYVRPDTINEVNIYNHFSLLKTVSDLLGVTPLGYADLPGVPALSPSLFLTTKR